MLDKTYQDTDFCAVCAPLRRREGLGPLLLLTLPVRTDKGNIVKVCEDCDGGAAKLGMMQSEQE